jgi:maltoporin
MTRLNIRAACAATLMMASAATQAADPATVQEMEAIAKRVAAETGLNFFGYLRSGFYGAANDGVKGGYALGGDLQKFRLGNEGDNYFELGLGKQFDAGNGVKWGLTWMPKVYNGDSGTAQIFAQAKGFAFAPEVSFWAGQRYHRIQDIHIVDHWLMQDGDNYGAGADGINLGFGKLNVALHTEGNADNKNRNLNNAKRLNLQLQDMATNPGGKLALTLGMVKGDFSQGSNGAAVGLLHNQDLGNGWNNALFLQTSNGHASLSGQFYDLGEGAGAKQTRIANALNWQSGALGGQALVGYQTLKPESGGSTKDLSLGGRVSYAMSHHIKLLAELGINQRKVQGQDAQTLSKGTVAVALSPDGKFWTRPELRLYVTRAQWNNAARDANLNGFARNGRKSNTTVGLQVEAWW